MMKYLTDESHRPGRIEVICGSMLSGKIEELIRRMRRASSAKQRAEIFKPAIDTRYSEENAASHDQYAIQSTPVDSSSSILLLSSDADVVGIGEVQFFDDGPIRACNELANKGVRVIIAGPDMDFQGKPFGPIPGLCAIADGMTRVYAICVKYGALAYTSHRLVQNDKHASLGEKLTYEPLYRERYQKTLLEEQSVSMAPQQEEKLKQDTSIYENMKRQEITFDKFIRIASVLLLIFPVLYLVNYLSGVLLPLFVAWFFAYLLYPLMKLVQYEMHIKVRTVAIIITTLAVAVVIGGLVYVIIPPMIEQFGKLNNTPNNWINQSTHSSDSGSYISQWITENRTEVESFMKSKDLSDILKTGIPKVFASPGQTAGVVISIIASLIALLYTFFTLQDYESSTDNWIRIFPKKDRPFWEELIRDVEKELDNYIRRQKLISLILGILSGIGLSIINSPMVIALGIMMGFMNLVLYLHTSALVLMVFLSMLKAADTGQNFWIVFGLATLVFLIIQVISDTVFTPKIMGKAMNLNPAILPLSLSAWGTLLGFIGLIAALLLTTLLITYWQKYMTREKEQDETTQEQVLEQAEEG